MNSSLDLKKSTSKLIHDKLSEWAAILYGFAYATRLIDICACGIVPKMHYADFDQKITAKYGIVVEGWPLKSFEAPGNLRSLNKLHVLSRAWENGSARFRKMDKEELDEWQEARFQDALGGDTMMGDNEGK